MDSTLTWGMPLRREMGVARTGGRGCSEDLGIWLVHCCSFQLSDCVLISLSFIFTFLHDRFQSYKAYSSSFTSVFSFFSSKPLFTMLVINS